MNAKLSVRNIVLFGLLALIAFFVIGCSENLTKTAESYHPSELQFHTALKRLRECLVVAQGPAKGAEEQFTGWSSCNNILQGQSLFFTSCQGGNVMMKKPDGLPSLLPFKDREVNALFAELQNKALMDVSFDGWKTDLPSLDYAMVDDRLRYSSCAHEEI